MSQRDDYNQVILAFEKFPGVVEQAQRIARAVNVPNGPADVLLIAVRNGLDEMGRRYLKPTSSPQPLTPSP